MFNRKSISLLLPSSVILVLLITLGSAAAESHLSDMEQLGKSIFFDTGLSINRNQSCASCHAPETGFTGPTSVVNAAGSVYEGSIIGRFGDRKPPTAAYATQSPIFFNDKGTFTGGNFWDGRATGERLGNPAAEQALGPFLNPKEQGLPDSACVVYRVCTASYPVSFEDVWGAASDCDISWPSDIEVTCAAEGTIVNLSTEDRAESDADYDLIGLAIASYEGSVDVNAFSSKHDQTFDGKVKLNKEEQRGYALFRGKAMCHRCHTSNGQEALFTDYTFDNLGVPKNPLNPMYDTDPGFVDPGLGGFLRNAHYPEEVYMAEWGKHKVPTLRNVDLRPDGDFVKAFAHNGYFKSLEGIVHFYNTRDVKDICPGDYTEAQALAANCWPEPEVAENVNLDELGDLGLTAEEEAQIVAFLRALSDGYVQH